MSEGSDNFNKNVMENDTRPVSAGDQLDEAMAVQRIADHRELVELLGGLIPAGASFKQVQRVLNLGYGSGYWALEMDRCYPGVFILSIDDDIHQSVDALEAGERFDLVHARFLTGYIAPSQLGPLVRELVTHCEHSALLVWTEWELPITGSAAFQSFCSLVAQAAQKLERSFVAGPGNALGLCTQLVPWLTEAGCRVIQDVGYVLDISRGQPAQSLLLRYTDDLDSVLRPIILSTGLVHEAEYRTLWNAATRDVLAITFCGVCFVRTVVALKL